MERFRRYVQRAAAELSAYNLNQLAHRMAMLLEGEAGMAAVGAELKAEHERREEAMKDRGRVTGYTSITAFNPRFRGICGSMADHPPRE